MLGWTDTEPRRDYIINCGRHGAFFGFGQLKGFENLFIVVELSTGGHSPHRWRGDPIRILLARGSRGLCPLLAALARLQQS
jgi:hypothetical protein